MTSKNQKQTKKDTFLNTEDSELKSRIISLFSTGNIDDRQTATNLCMENHIDIAQFALYIHPEEEHKELIIISSSQKDLEKICVTSSLSVSDPLWLEKKHKEFPYSLDVLNTLSERVLSKLVQGCINSYGSKSIIELLNPAEYLAKLYAVPNLKTDVNFKNSERKKITKGKNTNAAYESAFYEVIRYLDSFSYKRGWKKITSQFDELYSTSKNEQRARFEALPTIEKRKFVNSLLKPLTPLVPFNTSINPQNQTILKPKEYYAAYLLKYLHVSWNNLNSK